MPLPQVAHSPLAGVPPHLKISTLCPPARSLTSSRSSSSSLEHRRTSAPKVCGGSSAWLLSGCSRLQQAYCDEAGQMDGCRDRILQIKAAATTVGGAIDQPATHPASQPPPRTHTHLMSGWLQMLRHSMATLLTPRSAPLPRPPPPPRCSSCCISWNSARWYGLGSTVGRWVHRGENRLSGSSTLSTRKDRCAALWPRFSAHLTAGAPSFGAAPLPPNPSGVSA